ncbi:MAG: 2-hydroxyacyl-CoA dehydratase [Planctomycetota bacterium]|jgi:benzoyl-CoA reductase/2-hydroxyglutaryl-CoA dehydratase subunit BcrC/BadD/HgdB
MMTAPDLSICLEYFRETVSSGSAERELIDFKGTVIGTFCNFVPEELVWAAGGRTIRLCGGRADWAEAGEETVSREVCPVVKAAAALPAGDPELWERLDLLVVPASCDGKKKLADVLARSRPVHVMDLPAVKNSEASRRHWQREVERLAERIERLAGTKITRAGLEWAVRLSERREEQFRRLLALRHRPSRGGAVLTGEEFLFVANASFADEPGRYTDRLETLVAAVEARHEAGWSRARPLAPRIVLAGAPLIYPNYKLLRVVEQKGAVVVADDSCAATHRLYLHLAPRDASRRAFLEALADKTLLPSACPCFCSSDDRIARVKELVRTSSADGVIYHQLQNCTLFAVDARILRPELERDSIPTLVVNTDYGPSDVDQIALRVEAFLEMLAGSGSRGPVRPQAH